MKRSIIFILFVVLSSVIQAAEGDHCCGATILENLPDEVSRINAVGGRYALIEVPAMAANIATANVAVAQWDWTYLDSVMSYNTGKRKVVYTSNWPAWWSTNNQAVFMSQFSNYVYALSHRYTNDIWCIQVFNEPAYLGYPPNEIPEVTNDAGSLYAALVAGYQAAHAAVAGTSVLLGGPGFSSHYDWPRAASVLDDYGGRVYLDVIILHCYNREHPLATADPLNVVFDNWHTVAAGLPVVVSEFALYGQSASSAQVPNSGATLYNSAFTEGEGVRDAVTAAMIARQSGIESVMVHAITACSSETNDNRETSGYEFWDGVADWGSLPQKSKTQAFLNTMRLCDRLSSSQVSNLAYVVRMLQ